MKGRRSVKRERERETGRGESEEEEDWDMIRECVSKGVCMQEGEKSERERLVFMLAHPLRGRCME